MDQFVGTGRRKTSVARVYLRPGKGSFTINGRTVDTYFQRPDHQVIAQQALQVTEKSDSFDVIVNVRGGGKSGQAEAIRHAAARALVNSDEELHKTLRVAGYLTRDSRMVERKKYGRPGARRRFQFSKR